MRKQFPQVNNKVKIKISYIKLPAFHYQNNALPMHFVSVLHFAVCPFITVSEQSSLAYISFYRCVFECTFVASDQYATVLVWTLEDR